MPFGDVEKQGMNIISEKTDFLKLNLICGTDIFLLETAWKEGKYPQ